MRVEKCNEVAPCATGAEPAPSCPLEDRSSPLTSHHGAFYETGPEDCGISVRRQSRLELEANIARYAELYDHAPVAYFILGQDGAICEANLTGAGLLGITRASLAGRSFADFVSRESQNGFKDFLSRVFRSNMKETCELNFMDSDGNTFFAHVEANADGPAHRCRVVLCDTNERMAAESTLLDSEDRFRLMANSAPVLIWIADESRRHVWFNKMWIDFTGRPLDDQLGSGWLEGVHKDDRDMCLATLEKAFVTQEAFSMEYRLRHHRGQYHTMLAHGSPRMSPAGSLLGFIGSCTDISARKRIEEALQQSRQILRHLVSYQERVREDERKRIAREIHDDLGQNLLALRIDVSMLYARTSRTHPRLNDRVKGALAHIDATMKAVRAAINNLRPTVLDLGLNAAIEWQVQDFERRSGIACSLSMEDDFKLDDARATALFRILQESLNNVIRHARATKVCIGLLRDTDRLVMKIADNGIGLYPDCRRKANSFGLVGIEERISALGGRLEIDGNAQKGTTLTIVLPL